MVAVREVRVGARRSELELKYWRAGGWRLEGLGWAAAGHLRAAGWTGRGGVARPRLA